MTRKMAVSTSAGAVLAVFALLTVTSINCVHCQMTFTWKVSTNARPKSMHACSPSVVVPAVHQPAPAASSGLQAAGGLVALVITGCRVCITDCSTVRWCKQTRHTNRLHVVHHKAKMLANEGVACLGHRTKVRGDVPAAKQICLHTRTRGSKCLAQSCMLSLAGYLMYSSRHAVILAPVLMWACTHHHVHRNTAK